MRVQQAWGSEIPLRTSLENIYTQTMRVPMVLLVVQVGGPIGLTPQVLATLVLTFDS